MASLATKSPLPVNETQNFQNSSVCIRLLALSLRWGRGRPHLVAQVGLKLLFFLSKPQLGSQITGACYHG